MTFNEDTGEDAVCHICGAQQYSECGHLVADFDRTFLELLGGELFDRDDEFKSLIEEVFIPHVKAGTIPPLHEPDLIELWASCTLEVFDDAEWLELDGHVFQRVLIEALKGAGAIEPEGSLIDPGGPGMTSSVTLLFSEGPKTCIKDALIELETKLHAAR